MKTLTPDQIVVSERCPDCHGIGSVKQGKHWLYCEECDGTGRVIQREHSTMGVIGLLLVAAALGIMAGLVVLNRWGFLP